MIEDHKIRQIAQSIATVNLSSSVVSSVLSSTKIDSEGDDTVLITIVVAPGSAEKIQGEAAIKTLSGILREFEKQGDDRFPIIKYATEDELAAVGDI